MSRPVDEQGRPSTGWGSATERGLRPRAAGWRPGRLSKNGNDPRAPGVVNLVGEDGIKASIHNARIEAQAVSRDL